MQQMRTNYQMQNNWQNMNQYKPPTPTYTPNYNNSF